MPDEPTVAPLTRYRATAYRRWQRDQQVLQRRQQRAWSLARQAATLLRDRFGADRVVVFGSLIHPGCFTRWSDVDLAAWGICPQDTLAAMAAVLALDATLPINLVDSA